MQEAPLSLRSWPHAIVHVDGDAFFASCEQSVHPEYRGKPVITGQERNIVASMSYEAKALGIKRGTPLWQAKKICPSVIILPSDYETYSLISKRMFSILRRFTPFVEESSIDEGYADIDGMRRLHRMGGYTGIAREMQRELERDLGISISVGLSLNKTLSKLAAKFKKPHGFTAVRGRDLHLFLKEIPVEEVCGIGSNTTDLLNKQGVFTAYEYVSKPEFWIRKLWGKTGVELWRELRGEKVYTLNTEEKSSYYSIMKTKTFTPPSNKYEYVKAQLFRNVESAFIKMRRYDLRAKKFYVFIKTQDFKSRGVESCFSRSIMNPLEAFPYIEQALQYLFDSKKLYRSTGVGLTHLEPDHGVQFELFESPLKLLNMRSLAHSWDEINERYGKHSLFSGQCLFLKKNKEPNNDGRHALAERKKKLLPGETFRRRLKIPWWQIEV